MRLLLLVATDNGRSQPRAESVGPMSEQIGLAVSAVVAHLEREHGRARLLHGDERERTAMALGVWQRCAVIDIGAGRVATVGPRGGGLLIHNLHDAQDSA